MEIIKISEGDYSTFIGMNGGMIESPDGKKLVYARKRDLSALSGMEIWICDNSIKNHRHLYTVNCLNHNGPSTTFLNNSQIVFRDITDGVSSFIIMDINSGRIKHRIFAKESHCAENGKYPFSVTADLKSMNSEYPQVNECGIYLLDIETGDITLAVQGEEIINIVKNAGLTPTQYTASVSHVQLNPSATSVMMRLSVEECPVFGALGCIDLDTHKSYLIPDKPVHQLWYDDETYMATRQFFKNGKIEMDSSYIARFSKNGEELEVLGGIANHIDGNYKRTIFAGDRCYPGYSPDIYLYEKGNKTHIEHIPLNHLEEITWKKQVHPNPSFSRNGKRLYFNCPINNEKTEAVFVEL